MPRRNHPRADAVPDRTLIRVSIERRRLCQWLLLPAAQLVLPRAWAEAGRIASARMWPAQEYTRVILESPEPIAHQLLILRNPERLVLDLAGTELTSELAQLPSRVQSTDPYIARIRVGKNAPTVVRVVLDVKTEVKADAFALQPFAEYGHRLVLDIYPLIPVDPLMALLEGERATENVPTLRPPEGAASSRDRAQGARVEGKPRPRRITIAIDPGHGGENPGQLQVREQPIDAVGALAHFLDEQDRTGEVGYQWRSKQAREHFQISAEQGAAGVARAKRFEAGEQRPWLRRFKERE